MKLLIRRHYWLFIVLLLVLGFSVWIAPTRIISYHFGEAASIEVEKTDHTNAVSLFDETQVHEIQVDLSSMEYDLMVNTYQKIGEKDYYRTSVMIDGVTIPNVGIRLKGNLTLRQTLGGEGNGQALPGPGGEGGEGFGPGGPPGFPGGMNPFGELDLENPSLPPNMELPENWESMMDEEKQAFLQEGFGGMLPGLPGGGGPGGGMFGGEGSGGNPPYLIKFDAFVEGQSYQGITELSVRLGGDQALLAEPVAFALHEAMGQIVPDSAYAVISVAENEPSLYVITEHIDQSYVEKHFSDEDGILYKAGNFVGFAYKGDDPELYVESFEQKTNQGDDDLSQLIAFMKFVSESSDEEFISQLEDWVDVDPLIRMMALDNLLQNNDSFVGMGSNYYLFYSKTKRKFTLLSWDQNLALGSMPGGFGREEDGGDPTESGQADQEVMEQWLGEGGFGQEDGENVGPQNRFPGGPGGSNGNNKLKDRIMENETFAMQYQEEYDRMESLIFDEGLGLEIIDRFTQPFLEYNKLHQVMEELEYVEDVEQTKGFFAQDDQEN